MKLIIAYIQPERLEPVTRCLVTAQVCRISVTNAIGCGSQLGYSESYRGAKKSVRLHNKIRLEIAVNDEFEQRCIDAIIEGAHSGNIGDGKIFVLDLPRVIRIRTREEGPEAVG
jgi:nitrogen regulatory protein P-II 2